MPTPGQRWAMPPAAVTRQTVLPTSSATSSAPRLSIATPTGRPCALPSRVEEAGQHVDRRRRRACRRRRARRSPCSRCAACGSTSRAGRRTRRSRSGAGSGVAVVEGQAERGGVRAERVVGRDRLGDQVGPRRLHARRRRAGRSSCRASRRSRRPHRGHVVGHQVAAELVALVDRRSTARRSSGSHAMPYGIAQAGGEDAVLRRSRRSISQIAARPSSSSMPFSATLLLEPTVT